MADPIKILLVEDDDDLRTIYHYRLEVNGFKVTQARDGEEALSKVKEVKPDVILMDLMMPKMNGYEVCRMLKFDDATKNVPIIILSALSQQKDREKAIEYGADSIFIKPFELELLITKIKSLVKK